MATVWMVLLIEAAIAVVLAAMAARWVRKDARRRAAARRTTGDGDGSPGYDRCPLR